MTYTFLPSVTGEGDDMLCFLILTLPAPSGFFQRTVPFLRSTHQNSRLSPSPTLRKTKSRQTIGVDPLTPGSANFQTTFSSGDQRTGRFFSPLKPLRFGPRH